MIADESRGSGESDTRNKAKASEANKTIQKTLTVKGHISFGGSIAIGNFVEVKKVFAILLIMLYGVSSTGATVQLHYCCGKLKTVKLSTAPVKDCGNKHKMGSKPCCETKEIKARSQEQQDAAILVAVKAPVEAQTFFTAISFEKDITADVHLQTDYTSPPLSEAIFLFNCVFRI